jgi:hypothetical protein
VQHENDALATYLERGGLRRVEGWLSYGAARALVAVGRVQANQGVEGHLGEIGVFRGRSFICLLLLAQANERTIGVEPFSYQSVARRQMHSTLLSNLRIHAAGRDDFRIDERDSASLSAADLVESAGGPIRLFHIDGAHDEAHVRHDVEIAAGALSPDGVLIADDYFNERYPGVADGVQAALRQPSPPDLVPFAVGENKVLFARSAAARMYRTCFTAELAGTYRSPTTMLGNDVVFFAFEGWEDHLPLPPYVWQRLAKVPPLPLVRSFIHRHRGYGRP